MKLPIIMAPMFLVSTPKMVIEACKRGIIGSFPLLNARTLESCEEWLSEIKENVSSDQTWAVNYIAHKTNKRFEEDLGLIEKYQPPVVIVSLGYPGKVVETVHRYGGLVYADVANVKHARKSAEAGVDGLILVCAGAGGHGGTLHPFAFFHAVKEFWNKTIILSGAISEGEDILSAQTLGADYVYMGTRFIATTESAAFPEYKDMLLTSTTEDILYSNSFSGVYANYLIPSLQRNNIDPALLKHNEKLDLDHMIDAKAWRDIWSAGQGVTMVEKVQTVAEVIEELELEYLQAVERMRSCVPDFISKQ